MRTSDGRLHARQRGKEVAVAPAYPKARKLDLTTSERDPARGAPASPSPPIRLMPALRAAQPFSVRLHHRQKNLSTGPDTQLMKRLTRIENDAEQGQRHVDRDRLPSLDSTPAAAEVEWGNWGDIRDDFDKLRVTNAALRVMVFSGGTDHCRVRENLLRRIQADARPTSPIRYLLAACKPHGPPWFLYDHIDYIDCTGDGVRPSW